MSIWNKLGFGSPSSDEPVAEGSAPAKPEDLSQSRAVIHNSSDDPYWDEFQDAIRAMSAKELNNLNYRLKAGVDDFSHWREYADSISTYQWFRFYEAYHWATGQTFQV